MARRTLDVHERLLLPSSFLFTFIDSEFHSDLAALEVVSLATAAYLIPPSTPVEAISLDLLVNCAVLVLRALVTSDSENSRNSWEDLSTALFPVSATYPVPADRPDAVAFPIDNATPAANFVD